MRYPPMSRNGRLSSELVSPLDVKAYVGSLGMYGVDIHGSDNPETFEQSFLRKVPILTE